MRTVDLQVRAVSSQEGGFRLEYNPLTEKAKAYLAHNFPNLKRDPETVWRHDPKVMSEYETKLYFHEFKREMRELGMIADIPTVLLP